MLTSTYEESDQHEAQTESPDKSQALPVITSVVANSELQELSNNSEAAESQDKHEDQGRTRGAGKKLKNTPCKSNVNSLTVLETDSNIGTKSFRCDTCGKDFKQSRSLRVHMRIHTGEKPYKCKTCGRGFAQYSSLMVHLRTHTGEKPFHCKPCGKYFTTVSAAKIHMRRAHISEKPYVCQTCGKGFRVKYDLVRHTRMHTGEKPYVCKTCGKGFAYHSGLTQHLRTHTGEKPYHCKTCGKAFTVSSNMTKHQRLHAGKDSKVSSCVLKGKVFNAHENAHR